tara:strand:- start:65 stop:904 length:840 start_codon:yes stop_codon:yes gene_type:complete
MKKFFFAAIFTLSIINLNSQEIITNESIIQMKELGFDESLIIDKINSSDVDFDSSILALNKLKKAGASTSIISLVMEKSKFTTQSETGIYFLNSDNTMTEILPSVFSSKNANAAARALASTTIVGGLMVNSKGKLQLPKNTSNNVIKFGLNQFIFIFDPDTDIDNMNTGGGNPSRQNNPYMMYYGGSNKLASSPNEYILMKMRVKKNKNLREIITVKSGALANSVGIDPKLSIPFSIEKIGKNKYKVITKNLEKGEYCFIYQGELNSQTNKSVFDFSVQ